MSTSRREQPLDQRAGPDDRPGPSERRPHGRRLGPHVVPPGATPQRLLGDDPQRLTAPVERLGAGEAVAIHSLHLLGLHDHARRAQGARTASAGTVICASAARSSTVDMPALPLTRAACRVRARHLDARDGQVASRPLLHGPLAQRGEHVGDVVEEDPVRSDDQHAFTGQHAAVLEQQVGGPVQPDGESSRSRDRLGR